MNYGSLVESTCIVVEHRKKHRTMVPYVVSSITINEF